MSEYVRLVTGTSSYVPWNGRGRRLVEMTDECYSGGDSQGLPGSIKSPPCPWHTHYQFSIKTLLSNKIESLPKMCVYVEWSVSTTEHTDYFVFIDTNPHLAHCMNCDDINEVFIKIK